MLLDLLNQIVKRNEAHISQIILLITLVNFYYIYTSYTKNVIGKIPFNRSIGVLVPLVNIKSVLIIVDWNMSFTVDLKDSERWLQVGISNACLTK
jgi:hypothetical protein